MSSTFLNLEQAQKSQNVIDTVMNEKGVHSSTESVLTAITEFYTELYSNQDSQTEQEIINFLDSIPSLPKIVYDTTLLTLLISEEDVAWPLSHCNLEKLQGVMD